VLEIVESESIRNYEDVYHFIKRIKELGCKIAIDDFGSGYSNFEHIVNLSEYLDYLKLDGSLIKNVTTDRNMQVLIGSIKYFCDNLGIKTIAEYVDNEEALEYLTWIGVDYSQGFYLGKPSTDLIDEPKV
jgi:EAL domain-containing protein (putative c-di-GMP-specific phosphodiesterase class I)